MKKISPNFPRLRVGKSELILGEKKFEKVRKWGINGIYQNGFQKALSPNLPHGRFGGCCKLWQKVRKTTVSDVKTVVP